MIDLEEGQRLYDGPSDMLWERWLEENGVAIITELRENREQILNLMAIRYAVEEWLSGRYTTEDLREVTQKIVDGEKYE